jgi:hypothetical protein
MLLHRPRLFLCRRGIEQRKSGNLGGMRKGATGRFQWDKTEPWALSRVTGNTEELHRSTSDQMYRGTLSSRCQSRPWSCTTETARTDYK